MIAVESCLKGHRGEASAFPAPGQESSRLAWPQISPSDAIALLSPVRAGGG